MNIEQRVLRNGLKVSLVARDSPVSLFQLATSFGSDVLAYQHEGKTHHLRPGSAHFFEHVLFIMPPLGKDGKPIKYRTRAPLTKKNVRNAIAELEGNKALAVNAYTDRDVTNYWFATIQNKERNLETLFDFVFEPYLPQDRFKQEVGTIADEMARYEADPGDALYTAWMRQAYHGGPHHPVIGTREDIENISVRDVLKLHDAFYTPSLMHLIAIGQEDLDSLCEFAEEQLDRKGISYRSPPSIPLLQEPTRPRQESNLDEPIRRSDVVRPTVFCGWKNLALCSPDLAAQLDVAQALIFGGSSVSYERLIERGLDERTLYGFPLCSRDHQELVAYVEGNPAESIAAIRSAPHELAYTDEDLAVARNSVLIREDSIEERMSKLARGLVRWAARTGDPRDYTTYVRELENLSRIDAARLCSDEKFCATLMVPK